MDAKSVFYYFQNLKCNISKKNFANFKFQNFVKSKFIKTENFVEFIKNFASN